MERRGAVIWGMSGAADTFVALMSGEYAAR